MSNRFGTFGNLFGFEIGWDKADLEGAKFCNTTMPDGSINNPNCKRQAPLKQQVQSENAEVLSDESTKMELLRTKKCYGCILNGDNLSGTDSVQAKLNGANLSGANLLKASLTGATLVQADLLGADLSNAELYNTILYGAYLDDANLNNSLFCNTTMPDGSINNDDC